MEKKYTVQVYIDDGRVFEYDVENSEKVREHAAAIVKTRYRHNNGMRFEHYPVHRILKVKCSQEISTLYPDRVRGT